MLSLEAFSTFVPDNKVLISDLAVQTQLPKEMLSFYRVIYGLRSISIWNGSVASLIDRAISVLTFSNIAYVIYVHTASFVSVPGYSELPKIKDKFGLQNAISFEMSMYKCVSYFKALEILSVLLRNNPSEKALIITGEIAFTPKLRVVPRSTIVGDASTASIISFKGDDHRLLSVSNKIILGFENGIYLNDAELRFFDTIFIQKMTDNIMCVIKSAHLSLEDIALILPHNVNIPTWQKIAIALHFPFEKIVTDNIECMGHCFCSDHLINLQLALSQKRLKKGDYYLMVGCGLGFYISAALFQY